MRGVLLGLLKRCLVLAHVPAMRANIAVRDTSPDNSVGAQTATHEPVKSDAPQIGDQSIPRLAFQSVR